MKIVKNTQQSKLMIDDKWDINVSYASNTITMNVVMSYDNIVWVNTSTTIDTTKLTPTLENFTAYTILTDVNPEGLWVNNQNKILNPTPNVITTSYVVDTFKMTYPSKLSIDDFLDLNDKLLLGALIVPFHDSTPNDMIFLVRGPYNVTSNITYSGFSEALPAIGENEWIKFYPSLSANGFQMNTNSTQSFTIQLTDYFGNTIAKPNVTIYLDNTGGLLLNKQIVTDDNGIATGHITSFDTATFKIKAGFKYFSGVVDIPVKVV